MPRFIYGKLIIGFAIAWSALTFADGGKLSSLEYRIIDAEAQRRSEDPVFKEALSSSTSFIEVRRALLALGRIGDPRNLNLALALLQNPDPKVRSVAAFAAGMMASPGAVAPVTERLALETDREARGQLVMALARSILGTWSDEVSSSLLVVSKNAAEPPSVRIWALTGLNQLLNKAPDTAHEKAVAVIRELLLLLKTPETQVAVGAARTIGQARKADLDSVRTDVVAQLGNQTVPDEAKAYLVGGGGGYGGLATLDWRDPNDSAVNVFLELLGTPLTALRTEVLLTLAKMPRADRVIDALSARLGAPRAVEVVAALKALYAQLVQPELGSSEAPAGLRIKALLEKRLSGPGVDAVRAEELALLTLVAPASAERVFSEAFSEGKPQVVRWRLLEELPRFVGLNQGAWVNKFLLQRIFPSGKRSLIEPVNAAFGKLKPDAILPEVLEADGAVLTAALAARDSDQYSDLGDLLKKGYFPERSEEYLGTYDLWKSSQDAHIRKSIIETIGALGAKTHLDLVVRALDDPMPAVAAAARATFLALTGNPSGKLPALNPLIGVPTPRKSDIEAALRKRVRLTTTQGVIELRLNRWAPLNAANFVSLVNRGYFNNNVFHRVAPDWVVQAGYTYSNDIPGPSESWPKLVPDEASDSHLVHGALGMGISGKDTGSSVFFVNTADNFRLDGSYSLFGQTVLGEDVLDRLTVGDRILSATTIP